MGLNQADYPLSRVVAGMWRVMQWHMSREELAAFIEKCVSLGVTTFDHADVYGNYQVEKVFGDALSMLPNLRDHVRVVTKAGIKAVSSARPQHRIKHYDSTASHLRASVERSLVALRRERIELFLLHRPDPLMHVDDLALEVERLISSGKIERFGVSNFTSQEFQALNSRVNVSTNQIELSPFHDQPIVDGTLVTLQQAAVRPMIWSPLGGGRLFDEGDATAMRVRAALQQIQRDRGAASWVSVAYAWVMRLPTTPSVITGTRRIDGIKAALEAVNIELTREEWFSVWEAARGRGVD
jgi:predicted oxidoreductase